MKDFLNSIFENINRYFNFKVLFNLPYVLWLLFYYFLFSLLFSEIEGSFLFFGAVYSISVLASLTIGESITRTKAGVRTPSTQAERSYLLPIFEEVYAEARRVNPRISRHIKLYVHDSMDINAFAFGRSTLVITKGSIQLLDESALYGLMAHEFGHFSNWDTHALIVGSIGNITLTLFARFLDFSFRILDRIGANDDKRFMVKMLRGALSFIYKTIIVFGDLILMPVSRGCEYRADKFAFECGYGEELIGVLTQLTVFEAPLKFRERVLSTHPSTSSRIARLESFLDKATV